jgi:6-pyruvoyltetrahydropterin/6-carboxytetrahydropterin synthase
VSRWVLHSEADFEARHALTSYLGAAEESHGHHWQVAIRVGVDSLNSEGYAVDFHAVHQILADAVAPLAGTDLNQHEQIGDPSPTAERLAEVLAGWLRPPIEDLGAELLTVSVWEGPENRVDLFLQDGPQP